MHAVHLSSRLSVNDPLSNPIWNKSIQILYIAAIIKFQRLEFHSSKKKNNKSRPDSKMIENNKAIFYPSDKNVTRWKQGATLWNGNEVPQIRIAEYHGVLHYIYIPLIMLLIRSVERRIPDETRRNDVSPFPSPRLPFFRGAGLPMFSRPRRKRTPGDIIATKRANAIGESGNEIEGGFPPFNGRNCVEFFSLVAGTVCSIVCSNPRFSKFPLYWDILYTPSP